MLFHPTRFTFQWHLTEKCNLRCLHCYQDSFTLDGLNENDLQSAFEKTVALIDTFNTNCNFKIKAHYNFTGGEPFLKKEFIPFLKKNFSTDRFTFAVLSNGYMPSEEDVEILVQCKPRFIQISLEGDQKTNDEIRGEGSFETATLAIKKYKKLNIPVMISFTANKKNYKSFPEVVKTARKYGAYKVWADRYLPLSEKDDLLMDTEMTKDFFNIIVNEQKKEKRRLRQKVTIDSNRALQFLIAGGKPYACAAGNTLLAILANGDLLPCRRMPHKLGNIMTDSLNEIFYNHPFIHKMRYSELQDEKCVACFYNKSCKGGLRCLSFATVGSPLRRDPNCWIVKY